jgi:molybdopterin converting factor small subunit
MSTPVRVRFFGMLHSLRKERGLPLRAEVEVADEGVPASVIAEQLALPMERIEGVFCNHRVRPLSVTIMPGDQIAFVPQGTPGPHRYFLGLYEAGSKSHEK